jgi:GNAT superfamily N-acetyltransferase
VIEPLPAPLFADAVALWHDCDLTRPWNDPDADLRRAMRGPTSTVLAACDDEGRLLGTAMVGHDGHRGWLVRACEQWVRERGIPKVQLMVRRTNPEVIGFYEALGYADADTVVLGRFLD